MAGRIVVMEKARILMQGTPREVFARADELMSAGLNVPEVTRVLMRLREKGLDVPTNAYTVEQAVAILKAEKEGTGC